MAEVPCRVASIGPKPVTSVGSVLDKRTATQGQMIGATHEFRVLESPLAPNSAGFPTIESYILLEAADGYKVQIINQSWIITYSG